LLLLAAAVAVAGPAAVVVVPEVCSQELYPYLLQLHIL
jgi:hypothetical protein